MPSWFTRTRKWAIGAILLLLLGSYTYPLLGSLGYRNLAAHTLSVALTTDRPSLLAQAEAYAQQAVTYNPRVAGPLAYRLGIGYQQMGLAEEAIVHYQQALQSNTLAPSVLGDLLFRLAVYLNEKDELVAATQTFGQLLELDASELPVQTVAYANVYMAILLQKQDGDLLRQREYLDKALANWLDAFTMDHYLGLITKMRERGGEVYLQQALEMATIATRRQGRNTWTALSRCSVHLDRQEFDDAASWCERARDLDRKNHHAHVWLGIAYEHLSRWDEALAEFEMAASLTSDNSWYLTLIEEARRKLTEE